MSKHVKSIDLEEDIPDLQPLEEGVYVQALAPNEIVEALMQLDPDDLYDVTLELLFRTYGRDAILVYKPKDIDYYITSSRNTPSETKAILSVLTARM
jgi:hypothetical protein